MGKIGTPVRTNESALGLGSNFCLRILEAAPGDLSGSYAAAPACDDNTVLITTCMTDDKACWYHRTWELILCGPGLHSNWPDFLQPRMWDTTVSALTLALESPCHVNVITDRAYHASFPFDTPTHVVVEQNLWCTKAHQSADCDAMICTSVFAHYTVDKYGDCQ